MDITKDLDLSTGRDQYTLRSRYETTVVECVTEGTIDGLLDALHRVGVALGDQQKVPGRRGLLLDLWDIWKNAATASGAAQSTLEQQRPLIDRLVQSFVANRFPGTGLARLLEIDTRDEPALWRKALAGLLARTIDEGKQGNLDGAFSGCARLLFDLFEAEHGAAQDLLERQLHELTAWIDCRGGCVYGLQDIDAGGPDTATRGNSRGEEFALTLGLLGVLLEDCLEQSEVAAPSLQDVARAFSVRRPTPIDTLTFQRLVKHWAALVPLVDRLVRRCSQFSFYDENSGISVPRGPAPYGPECVVMVAGPKAVARTSFLFATQEATSEVTGTESPSAITPLRVESLRGEEHLNRVKAKWLGRDGPPNEGLAGDGLYAQAPKKGGYRLTLLDIPEPHGANDQDPSHSMPYLGEFLLSTRAPSALLLMTSEQVVIEASLCAHVLSAVQRAFDEPGDASFRKEAEHAQNLPVYFVINQIDTSTPQGDDIDTAQCGTLIKALVGEDDGARSGHRGTLLSSWMTRRPTDVPELLRLVEDSRRFCAFPPMQDRVLRDLRRLTPALDEVFGRNFSRVSIAYAACHPEDSRHPPHARTWGLRTLWADVQGTVGWACKSALNNYLEVRFQQWPQRSFEHLDELRSRCDLQGLGFPERNQLAADNETLRRLLGESAREVASSFPGSEPIDWGDENEVLRWGKANNPRAERFFTQLEQALGTLDERLADAAADVLRELGIPYSKPLESFESDWGPGEEAFRRARRRLLEHARSELVVTKGSDTDVTSGGNGGLRKAAEDAVRAARQALRTRFEQHGGDFVEFLNFVASSKELAAYQEATRRLQDVESKGAPLCTRELRFHPLMGAVDTVCPFRDSAAAFAVAATCFEGLQGHSIMNVFTGLRPDDDELSLAHGTPMPSFNTLRCALHALADYEPVHEQLAVRFWDTDQTRIDVLRDRKRWLLGDRREWLIDILETVWHLRALVRKSAATLRTRQSAYYLRTLLSALAVRGFRIGDFLDDPEAYLERLRHLRVELDKLLASSKIALSKRRRTARAERRQAILQDTPHVLDLATRGGSALLKDKKQAVSLLRELGQVEKIAEKAHAYLRESGGDDLKEVGNWRYDDLPLLTNPARTIGTLAAEVRDYVNECKAQLLQERATYLSRSGWLDDSYNGRLLELLQGAVPGQSEVTDVARLDELYRETIEAIGRELGANSEPPPARS